MMTEREVFIAIVNNDIIEPSDAIILLEGDGLNRYLEAVRLYNNNTANKIVFSGGITDYEYGSYPFGDIFPHLLQSGIPKDKIIHESKSLNTREQAIEIIKLSLVNKWRRLVLVASHEHQYRAYLTFLHEIITTKSDIVLYNAPVHNLSWFKESEWGIRYKRLELEFERIEEYSLLGHLATYSEAIEYQKWKEYQ